MLINVENMSVMQLAWDNAKVAHNWHGKGKKAEYLAGSMKLAWGYRSLRNELVLRLSVAALVTFSVALVAGAAVAALAV